MQEKTINDEIRRAQLEAIHLRETIAALRSKLESQEFEKDRGIQQVRADIADDFFQLKNTVSSLRDELESLRFEKDAAVQKAVQRSADEILQLKNTASSLRDE
ncbi:MAG: hypothetical protein ACPGQV_23115, partial [Alphaproteobacteria bacterium]